MTENKNNTPIEEVTTANTIGSFVWELVRVLAFALLIIVPLRLFIAEPFIVSGSSMFPTFHDKEYLVVDKVTYRFSEPKRGDVIVFRYPKDTSQFFIKRIIGLPGEKVKVESGHVIIYNKEHPEGSRLEEPYLPNQAVTFGKSDVLVLGAGEYYVLGDNRVASSDSRAWGVLPDNDIVGKAAFRVFPISKFGPITTPALDF